MNNILEKLLGLGLISRAIRALRNLLVTIWLVKQLSIGPLIFEPIRQLFSAILPTAENINYVDLSVIYNDLSDHYVDLKEKTLSQLVD